ncbi:MAG TPA: hypothetical protein VK090_04005 [Paracoccaceae bacterium]|nr:hypothetical protein [Paracoccaceae bacterium]
MIRFLAPLLSGVLAAGLASAAPLTIDSFDQAQGPLASANGATESSTVSNDGSFAGGPDSTRTIEVTGDGTPPPSSEYTLAEVGGGIFEYASAVEVSGSTTLTYESLGGLDLSQYLGFTFEDLTADHPFDYSVSIYDSFGGLSVASGVFTLPESISTDVLLSFSSFVGDVDLASIDSLVFGLTSEGRALDFSMSQISAAIPIPAAGFFLISALAGLGLLRTRRMAETA